MAKKTKAEAEETRLKILDSAIEVFYEKGVTGSSLNEIAERADVTRGAIYWHFKNKVDLFDALHEQLHQSLMGMILEDLETNHPEPLTQLQKLCTRLLVDVELNSIKRKTLHIFFLGCDYSGEMSIFLERQRKSKKESIKLFNKYFERALKFGHLPKTTEPNILTFSLLCYLTGIVFENLRDPKLVRLTTTGPALVEQYFKTLKID